MFFELICVFLSVLPEEELEFSCEEICPRCRASSRVWSGNCGGVLSADDWTCTSAALAEPSVDDWELCRRTTTGRFPLPATNFFFPVGTVSRFSDLTS